MPRPHSHEEKGLVTIEHFFGCAGSAVSILYKPMKKQSIMQALTLANEKALSSQRPNNSLIQKSTLLTWHNQGLAQYM